MFIAEIASGLDAAVKAIDAVKKKKKKRRKTKS
jgi:hypothetical protein